jgi:hypothetical protein
MPGEISYAPICSLIPIKFMFNKPQLNAASPGLPPLNLNQINHNVLCNPEALLSAIASNVKPLSANRILLAPLKKPNVV